MATEPEVTRVMLFMSVYYPMFVFKETTKDQPGTAKAYSMMLQDIPVDVLQAAAKSLVVSSKFFPSLSELKQCCYDIMLNKAGIPSAYEAWEELLTMIGQVEDRKRVIEDEENPGEWLIEVVPGKHWTNKIAEKVAHQLGWPDFPNGESISYERHAFIEAYEDACRRIDLNARTLPDVKRIEDKYSGNIQKSISALVESKEE